MFVVGQWSGGVIDYIWYKRLLALDTRLCLCVPKEHNICEKNQLVSEMFGIDHPHMWKSSFFNIDYTQRKEGSLRVTCSVKWHTYNNSNKKNPIRVNEPLWFSKCFNTPHLDQLSDFKRILYITMCQSSSVWCYREPLFNVSSRVMCYTTLILFS